MKTKIPFILLMLLASGCATKVDVTYYSDPRGATLYQNNQQLGSAPFTVSYPVSQHDLDQGYIVVPNIAARWVSGASTTLNDYHVSLSGTMQKVFDQTRSVVIQRPFDAPDRDKDFNYALELEKTEALQRQAAAQEAQAGAAWKEIELKEQQLKEQREKEQKK